MKRVIRFDRAYLLTALISLALILFGVFGLTTKGFNLGVDFQAGINQYVQFAYPAFEISYAGSGDVVLSVTDSKATLVFSGADVENRTVTYDLAAVGSLADLAREMSTQAGISARVTDGEGKIATSLVPTYQGDFRLGNAAIVLCREPDGDSERFATIEDVRKAAETLGSVSVQNLGDKAKQQYIVRLRDDGSDSSFSAAGAARIKAALEQGFGAGHVVVMKTDFVGARFSKDLADNAWKLTLLTLVVIMIYATIRFKLQYALGAVLAILHDALIVIGFIVWTRMEFNTSTLAAILTILGYSINDTIVIFDRIREDKRLMPAESIRNLMNKAITETLGRTFITTVTTMLAVLAIFFFTTGSMRDFALCLFVGMISGTYSTIFIASAFVVKWTDIADKRKNKKEAAPAKIEKPAPAKKVVPAAKPAK